MTIELVDLATMTAQLRLPLALPGTPAGDSAPRLETGDDRYRWRNLVQAVGKGTFDGRTLRYELYEVR